LKRKKNTKKNTKKSTIASEVMSLDFGSWLVPQILYRPERREYILKLNPPKGCVFCLAEKSGSSKESLVVYDSKHSFVVMNKYPYNTGHLLVVPKKHCAHIEELSSAEFTDFQSLTLTTIKVLKKSFNCAGLNVGMNLGYAAGAGIPDHLHQHVIPRWVGDMNFLPLVTRSKVMIETLDEVYKRLKPCFEELANG